MTKSLPPDSVRQEHVLWLVHYGRLSWERAERMSSKQRVQLMETLREWKRKESEQQRSGGQQGGQARPRPSPGSSGFATIKRGG